jgi:O-antigen/teichoic acid export membrane protein
MAELGYSFARDLFAPFPVEGPRSMTIKEIWSKVIHTGSIKVYSMVLGIGSLYITSRVLGPGGRGTVAAVQSWADLFHAILSLSVANAIFFMLKEKNRDAENRMYGTIVASSVALYFLSLAAFFVVYAINPDVFGDIPFPFLLFSLGGFLLYQIWNKVGERFVLYFDGLKRLNNAQFVIRTLGLAALFLFVYVVRLGTWGYVLSLLIPNVLIGLYIIKLLSKDYHLQPKFDPAFTRRTIIVGLSFHLGSIAGMLISRTDAVMINYFAGTVDLGYYDLAIRLVAFADILTQSIYQVSFVVVAQDDEKESFKTLSRLMLQSSVILAVVIAIAIFAAPLLIGLIAGDEFLPAIPYFQLLIWTTVPRNFSSFLTVHLVSNGMGKQSSILVIVVSIFNVVLNALLIPRCGPMGAVYATLTAHFLPLGVKFFMYRNIRRRIMGSE